MKLEIPPHKCIDTFIDILVQTLLQLESGNTND